MGKKNRQIKENAVVGGQHGKVYVQRPRIDIEQERGIDFRYKRGKRGGGNLIIGTDGRQQRIRSPPLFNEKEELQKMNGFRDANWGALPSGLEHFRNRVKKQPWKHKLMDGLSWNPLKADFVGYHGIKFLDNTRLKALTRLRKRQMMRRYAVAEEAEKRHKTTQKATGINAKYKQDLEAQVAEMKHANEQLWQARERVGKKGGPSLLQYERMLKEYAQRELRYHEAVGEGGSIHVKYSNTVGDLGKAANSQRGDIQNELRPMRHVRRDIRADRRKQTVQRRMEGQKGRGGEMKAARANLDRKLTQRNQQRRRYEKSA
jgi:hypothetical protein